MHPTGSDSNLPVCCEYWQAMTAIVDKSDEAMDKISPAFIFVSDYTCTDGNYLVLMGNESCSFLGSSPKFRESAQQMDDGKLSYTKFPMLNRN
jgi:hypothetical protein